MINSDGKVYPHDNDNINNNMEIIEGILIKEMLKITITVIIKVLIRKLRENWNKRITIMSISIINWYKNIDKK